MHQHGRQTIAKGRVGKQRVTEPVGGTVQRLQAFDNRAAVSTGQRTHCADPRALNRAFDDPGEVLAGCAKVADHLPDGVRRYVDGGLASHPGHEVTGFVRWS